MKKSLHDEIVYSKDCALIDSPAFYDCVVHLICNAGEGSFRYNGSRFTLLPDRIAVVSRPEYLSSVSLSPDFDGEFIAAPDKFLHNLLPVNNYSIYGRVSLFDNPIICVDKHDASIFRKDLANIAERVEESDHRFYREMIGSVLRTMIYDLFDFHVKLNDDRLITDRVGYIAARFFAMIEAGVPKTERDVAYYAGELNVTPKYLSDTIKRVSGMSVSAHITRAATSIIVALLEDSNLSISQIADAMNFASLSYFSRYCTKHIGMSPTGYRQAGANPQ